MAKSLYTFERDCSLDLHEALQILQLLFFTFEKADTQEDWFKMREPVGSGLHAVEIVLGKAMRRAEAGASALLRPEMH
ncbi:hypothetical protein [Mesorhizobium sp.]|uniref:hypothetical protein n=1 Tax=Mesorhizobium sp. TaxID=1871066 RepID=UPI000FE6AA73|nr:hypothetical protein [Mesorhizobium sp.]RWE90104.1 MAG: hypothetical protein EOS68_31410 [Mesorhizobium sp.]